MNEKAADNKSRTRGPRIFISYARDDRRVAQVIAERLTAAGAEAFFDVEMPVGESFTDSLVTAIRSSDCVIALMSPSYFASRWNQAEIAESLDAGKRVIPVRVRPCDIEGLLGYLQWLDLSDSAAMDRLVEIATRVQ
jgi:isopentenyl diphosphate isomerase/L-lactate dehydrogenase-like FMN-dependent dehydrogenase